MLVRIKVYDAESEKMVQNTYEANSFRTIESEDKPWMLTLDIYGPRINQDLLANGHEKFEIDKEKTSVYIMNDEGKTLESYTWDPQSIRRLKKSAEEPDSALSEDVRAVENSGN